ncbi:hypothetical protein ACFL2V_14855 [Pseudomonadota bacterium]
MIIDKRKAGGKTVYVKASQHATYQKLMCLQATNYHLHRLYKALFTINQDPLQTHAVNEAADIRTIRIDKGTAVEFYMNEGDIYISNLYFDGAHYGEESDPRTGLYPVGFDGVNWVADNNQSEKMELSHKWGESRHYAAVSGKFDNKMVAGSRLIDHIINGFNQGGNKTEFVANQLKEGNHYSMLWIQKGEHKADTSAHQLRVMFDQAIRASAPIGWLVHGEGAQTFAKAAENIRPSEYMQSNQSEGAAAADKAKGLEHQKVFFSNPKGVSQAKLKKLCEGAGLTYGGANLNPTDMEQKVRNGAKELCTKAMTATGKYSGAGAAGAGALMYDDLSSMAESATGFGSFAEKALELASTSTNEAMVGGIIGLAIAGVATGKKITGLHSNMRASAHSTFGKGNEFWYTNEKNLLGQLKKAGY